LGGWSRSQKFLDGGVSAGDLGSYSQEKFVGQVSCKKNTTFLVFSGPNHSGAGAKNF